VSIKELKRRKVSNRLLTNIKRERIGRNRREKGKVFNLKRELQRNKTNKKM